MKKIHLLAAILFILPLFTGCKNEKADMPSPIINDMQVMDKNLYNKIKEENKGKIVLINFFASWCPPCKMETPDFVDVYNQYKDKNFIIIGVSGDDNKKNAVDFVNRYGIEYPVYIADKSFQAYYGVSKYPTTFLLDKGGKLVDIYEGMLTKDYLIQLAAAGGD